MTLYSDQNNLICVYKMSINMCIKSIYLHSHLTSEKIVFCSKTIDGQ